MYCKGDSKGNNCGNESTFVHWPLDTTKKRRNKTIQQDAAAIREKVDADKRIDIVRNPIVDSVTIEVYTRLFGAN